MSRNVLTYSKSSFPCIFLLAGIFPPGVLVWEVSHWLFLHSCSSTIGQGEVPVLSTVD